ncbi:alpha/beta fold hydrolase [Nocardia sp. NPDC058666]|uniref:alpha/beta fold hydrolase n=1 Tax=Nocardia sp. NPDC058666 TaxID=3346587 RepID=UPI0036488678
MPTVELDAGRIHYRERGEGPPVVLLHGLLMNHTVWDAIIDDLPTGFRYVLPDLPLGAHPEPMNPGTDLSLRGLNHLVADFLAALDLHDVTLVHSDWGGALFLTAYGLDRRVSRLIIFPSEAFDNFPPGLPGRLAVLAATLPGGITLALRQMRIGWLRRSPLMFGQMTISDLPATLVHTWTEPGLSNSGVRADVISYLRSGVDKRTVVTNTEALQHFPGEALILWSSAGKVMPRAHGPRLAALLPHARLIEIDNAYVLSMLDQPTAVTAAITEFLTTTTADR